MRSTKERARRWAAPLAALALIVAGCGGEDDTKNGPDASNQTTVPPLEGDRMDTVYDQLDEAGLTGNAPYWDQHHVATDVTPAPGTVVDRGTEVKIVALSTELLEYLEKNPTVPDLVGLGYSEMLNRLGPVHLQMRARFVSRRDIPGGDSRVLRQTPAPGTPLTYRTRIRLVAAFEPGGDFPGLPGLGGDGPNPCRHTRYC